MGVFLEFWSSLVGVVRTIRVSDVIDMVIVSFLIYNIIKIIKETRAVQLLKGIIMLALAYFIAVQFGLRTIQYVLQFIFSYGIFALLIVFQPEIRRALEHVGRTKLKNLHLFSFTSEDRKNWISCINVLCDSAAVLSKDKTGALIVIERTTKLGDIIKSGTLVKAQPSVELICNIFFPNTPLHDGAMIVRDGRVYAAGCILPLSNNLEISKLLGTRHRASLGVSEVSDAIVVVVSEETGVISVAENGQLQRNLSYIDLNNLLTEQLVPPEKGVLTKEERKAAKKQATEEKKAKRAEKN